MESTVSKKLTKEIVNERLADRGIVMVGEYEGNKVKTLFRCAEGHEWNASSSKVMYTTGCPHCANCAPLTKEIVNKRLIDRKITLIGDYKGVSCKAEFLCQEGHMWKANPDDVMRGNGCPNCANRVKLTAKVVNERLAGRKIKLVGDCAGGNRKDQTFRCVEGHQWETTPSSVLNGRGCSVCSGKAELSESIVNERIADRQIKIIGEYSGSLSKATFQCGHGHKWNATPDSVMRGNGCPSCAEHGFNPTKPGKLYYLHIISGSTDVYKIGITNDCLTLRLDSRET